LRSQRVTPVIRCPSGTAGACKQAWPVDPIFLGVADSAPPYNPHRLYALACAAKDPYSVIHAARRMLGHADEVLRMRGVTPLPEAKEIARVIKTFDGEQLVAQTTAVALTTSRLAPGLSNVVWSHYLAAFSLERMVASTPEGKAADRRPKYVVVRGASGKKRVFDDARGQAELIGCLAAHICDCVVEARLAAGKAETKRAAAWNEERAWQEACLEAALGHTKDLGPRLRTSLLSDGGSAS